jgi:hypothetical protein
MLPSYQNAVITVQFPREPPIGSALASAVRSGDRFFECETPPKREVAEPLYSVSEWHVNRPSISCQLINSFGWQILSAGLLWLPASAMFGL